MSLDPNRSKPELDYPGDAVPTDLVIEDLIEGDGAAVEAGQTVTTHYVGWAFSTGEEFDASWNRGEPLSFRAGIGQVIRGWDQGLLGMKVGAGAGWAAWGGGGAEGAKSLVAPIGASFFFASSFASFSWA